MMDTDGQQRFPAGYEHCQDLTIKLKPHLSPFFKNNVIKYFRFVVNSFQRLYQKKKGLLGNITGMSPYSELPGGTMLVFDGIAILKNCFED